MASPCRGREVAPLGKDLVSLKDLTKEDIQKIITEAVKIKREPERYYHSLSHRVLLMLFQKTSTRTRLSFEVGMQQLGGQAVNMNWDGSNFSISPIRYEARYVSRTCDLVMARLKKHEDIAELAAWATVPVINGCCNRYHPCQALADLMTVYEVAGRLDGVSLAYVGIHNNVANSLVAGGTKVGLEVRLVTPIINDASWDEELMQAAEETGNLVRTLDKEAIRSADFVCTDTWVDMEFFKDPAYAEEKEKRMDTMLPYQIGAELLQGARPYLMHPMPIHPGWEIAEDQIEAPNSVIYQQAENRLHAQKAAMLHLLGALK